VDVLNAGRDGRPVGVDEMTRLYRGDLSGVLAWFASKPMPHEWAAVLQQHFTATEHLVVAFGCPRNHQDFFLVHDSAMRTVVECPLPDDRIAPAGASPPRR
jgi:hypothetical protein